MTTASITRGVSIGVRIANSSLSTNRWLTAGIGLLVVIVLFGFIGRALVNPVHAEVGDGPIAQAPSWIAGGASGHLLGTDKQGRDVWTYLILATPASIQLGLTAGVIGVLVGTFLGFTSAYFRGFWDRVVTLSTDVFMTIPALMILIVIASMIGALDLTQMALLIAAFSWPGPTRVIRAQVLSMRERTYVEIAKLNGVPSWKIIAFEMVPNLAPFLAAGLVSATAGAILAAIGLSTLGLGPQTSPSLGLMIHWVLFYGALIQQLWWWWAAPVIVLVLLFVGLFMLTAGLDEIANPRLKTSV